MLISIAINTMFIYRHHGWCSCSVKNVFLGEWLSTRLNNMTNASGYIIQQ